MWLPIASVTDTNAVWLGINSTAMAVAQTSSADIQAYNTALTNLQITSTKLQEQGPELLCHISTGKAWLIDPPDFRRSVFEAVHNLSHPGPPSDLFRKNSYGMAKNVKLAPGLKSVTNQYLITIIDRNTRGPEEIPIPTITTAECVQALVGGWISCFGIPEDISSDRGSQFTSALWTEIAKCLGVKVHQTTAFQPQANGTVERFHRTLKAALKDRLTGNNWVEELLWVLLGLRTASKEDLGYSSAELVCSKPLTVPGKLTPSQALPWSATEFLTAFRAKTQLLKPRPTVHHNKTHTYLLPSLLPANYVYIHTDTVKTPLQIPYSGPYMVLAPGEKPFLWTWAVA
ncbi:Pol polyprotein [Elysia marginata]|uniref:Pol polyprotein n=1 Tax=Elysia marginata TaxID=1093978 RepID=A0AAV4F5P9_9GAST|nr:Pol polyprotein [Elysia marginata]